MEKSQNSQQSEILPVEIDTSKIKQNSKYTEDIFREVPCTLFLGQTKAGKTILLLNYLLKQAFLKYDAKNIYVFSKTVLLNGENNPWTPFLKKMCDLTMEKGSTNILKTNIFTSLDEIKPIIKQIHINCLKGEQEGEVLLLIDDFIGNPQLQSRFSELSNFVPICRHFKIRFMILIQKLTKLSDVIRCNSDIYIIMNIADGMAKLIFEFPNFVKKQVFQTMLTEILSKADHSFIVYDKSLPFHDGMFKHYDAPNQIFKTINPQVYAKNQSKKQIFVNE